MILDIIIVMQAQLSNRVTVFLILGLTSLAVVLVTATYANAQPDTGSVTRSAATMADTSSPSSTTPVSDKQFSAVFAWYFLD